MKCVHCLIEEIRDNVPYNLSHDAMTVFAGEAVCLKHFEISRAAGRKTWAEMAEGWNSLSRPREVQL